MNATVQAATTPVFATPPTPPKTRVTEITTMQGLAFAGVAIAAFHLAYSFSVLSFLMVVYLFCLFQISAIATPRKAFYMGLLVGLAVIAPRMDFLWKIFNTVAIPLWLVIAFWHGLFVVLARQARLHCSPKLLAILIPLLWTGLEYFRSEIYFLKFSWFNCGYALAENLPSPLLELLGVYGVGWAFMTVAVVVAQLPNSTRTAGCIVALPLVSLLINLSLPTPFPTEATLRKSPRVAGIQLEFPLESELPAQLDKVLKKFPATDILVLSEYTLDGPVPAALKNWCRTNARHLVVGGKAPLPNNQFYNTAFVVGPTGAIVFEQVKNVPIQFFADGLPAPERKLWHSPWGKLGLAVCYDLNYRRVIDDFIRLGAQALIIPTMDVTDWGENQHRLHARTAPVRSAEYAVPIFRLCSSGISQLTDRHGRVLASAGFPGQEEILGGTLTIANAGRLPLDHWLAPTATAATGLFLVWLVFLSRRQNQHANSQPPTRP